MDLFFLKPEIDTGVDEKQDLNFAGLSLSICCVYCMYMYHLEHHNYFIINQHALVAIMSITGLYKMVLDDIKNLSPHKI